MSKTPEGKQSNTRFSCFEKTPKSEASSSDVLSPRRSPNSKSDQASDSKRQSKTNPKSAKKTTTTTTLSDVPAFSKGDLVWTKLIAGFPWWPSLVCDHPIEKIHFKGGKSPEVHIMFYDDKPTRAWMKIRNVQPFKGSDDESCQKGGKFYCVNSKVRQAVLDADRAMSLDINERMKVAEELPLYSSEEEDLEAEEDMDFDPSIIDAKLIDDEAETKENCKSESKEGQEVSSPNKKQSKSSPLQSTKVKRKADKEAEVKNKQRKLIKSESADDISGEGFKPECSDENEDDSISCVDEDDSIIGENEDDSIIGEDEDDSIVGEDEGDSISGEDEDDSISGVDEDDSISGEDEDESISSDSEDDSISGEDEDDISDEEPDSEPESPVKEAPPVK